MECMSSLPLESGTNPIYKPVDYGATCHHCGARLVGDGAYWVCPEHGRDCMPVTHFAYWNSWGRR